MRLIPTDITRETALDADCLLLQGDATDPLALPETLIGQAACVYLDPPFMTGQTFRRTRPYGTTGWKRGTPRVEMEGYSDRFESAQAYMDFLRRLILQAHRLLKEDGVFFLHLDWHGSALGRVVSDEVFGSDHLLNEIIWAYQSGGRSEKHYSRKHDVILFYRKGESYQFDITRIPLDVKPETNEKRNHMRIVTDEDGRQYRTIRSGGKEYRYPLDAPVYPSDVWTDISHLQQRDPERGGYPTQKPLALLTRLLKPVVEPGDLVADLMCGSGTTLVAAKELGCRTLGMDQNPAALHIAASRIMTGFELNTTTDPTMGTLTGTDEGYASALQLLAYEGRELPQADDPLAMVEQVRVGRLEDGTLQLTDAHYRSRTAPELPHAYPLPEDGEVGISITDCLGRRCIYRLEK